MNRHKTCLHRKISDLVDHVDAKVPVVWNRLELFIRQRHADVAVGETKTQVRSSIVLLVRLIGYKLFSTLRHLNFVEDRPATSKGGDNGKLYVFTL